MTTSYFRWNYSQKNHSTICSKGDRTQWIHLCRDKEIRLQPTTVQDNRKWLPYKEPSTTWIPTIQTHGRPLEAQMATGHIFTGCWWFRSKILPCGCLLDQSPVLWHQTRLELWSSKKRWPIHAKLCPQFPPWITTLVSKNTPKCTTQMVTPKLCNKNTMVKRGKIIRDPTIT